MQEPHKQGNNNVSEPEDKVDSTNENKAAVTADATEQYATESEVNTSQLTITQSQSVEGDEIPTQEWMVEQQLAEEEEKKKMKKDVKKRQKAINRVKKNLSISYSPEDSNKDETTPLAVVLPTNSTPLLTQTAATSVKRKRTSRSTQPESQGNNSNTDNQQQESNKQIIEHDQVSDEWGIDDDADEDFNSEEEQSEKDSMPEDSEQEPEGKRKKVRSPDSTATM